MSYKVYLGNYTIYGAESVDTTLSRPVTVHNGLGVGEFPVPEDKQLHTWTIKGEWTEANDYNLSGWEPAHEIVDGMKKIMGSDQPERLVMTNGYDKTSIEVLVTQVNLIEKYAGVYDFSLEVTEYKKTTVRSSGVPVIQRPGKVPEMPKTVVFNNASDVAGDALKRLENLPPSDFRDEKPYLLGDFRDELHYQWVKDGKPGSTKNPNMVPTGVPITVDYIKEDAIDYFSSQFHYSDQDPVTVGVKNTFKAIGDGYNSFKKWAKDTLVAPPK